MSPTPKCTNSDNYEAKIQLRPNNKLVYSFLIEELKKNKVTISKEVKLREGLDVYISSSKFCFPFSKRFKKKSDEETKITKSLVGLDKQKGKRIHRFTLLLRSPKPL